LSVSEAALARGACYIGEIASGRQKAVSLSRNAMTSQLKSGKSPEMPRTRSKSLNSTTLEIYRPLKNRAESAPRLAIGNGNAG